METMADGAFYIVQKNLERTAQAASKVAEKRFAHLFEQARLIVQNILKETEQDDVLTAILTLEDAAAIYKKSCQFTVGTVSFSAVNKTAEPFFSKYLSRFSKYYLCDAIASFGKRKTIAEISPYVCGTVPVFADENEKTVAFLRNGQASRAFECFARSLGGVSAVYENNFLNACESVYTGQATYAIIPVYSTSDGRLNSFYRQIEKYELSIILTCDIDSEDGENTTTYALVYKSPVYLNAEGTPLYECKITFEEMNLLAEIADAAAYYGVCIESYESLPTMFSGRNNAFSVIFNLTNANINGFFCYLALEYPQITAIGIYQKISK